MVNLTGFICYCIHCRSFFCENCRVHTYTVSNNGRKLNFWKYLLSLCFDNGDKGYTLYFMALCWINWNEKRTLLTLIFNPIVRFTYLCLKYICRWNRLCTSHIITRSWILYNLLKKSPQNKTVYLFWISIALSKEKVGWKNLNRGL